MPSLKAHVKHYKAEKKKMCDKCCKMFMHSCELKQHMLSHLDEKTFLCNLCNKKYHHKYELNRHIKLCGKSVECNECGKTLSNKNILRECKKNTHSKEKLCV